MKLKSLIIFAMTLLVAVPAFGWGRLGHAAIARIAEDHLTKTTRERVAEIMDGQSFVAMASYNDDYRKHLNKEFGPVGHTFCVDEQGHTFRSMEGCEGYSNNVLDIIRYADRLQNHFDEMTERERYIYVVTLVHIIGDMHCLGHVRYAPEFDSGSQKVIWDGNPTKFHSLLDTYLIEKINPWSFSDLAYLCDRYDAAQYREMVRGDVFDWGDETASAAGPWRKVDEGTQITRKWVCDIQPVLQLQICRAGYRLAHTLNTIFDKKYKMK